MGVALQRPAIVPWSRKAHELALHAREKGCFRQVHRSLFRAHFSESRDIGRVDVLVEIGAASGLDRTETKAILDVDRYAERLLDWRREAERTAVAGVPTVLFGAERLEGFSLERLEALLERIIHLSPR
jgi:predicted DsbA family dithiol-disulfide isomerase